MFKDGLSSAGSQVHSFLMIGQSNMAGRGYVYDVEPIYNERIKVLRNGRWQPFYRPLNNDRAFSGVCLIESFADYHCGHINYNCRTGVRL